MTVDLHSDKVCQQEELIIDTTVQESNIHFPTDTSLHVDCIHKLWKLGDRHGIKWRRRYTRSIPKLLSVLRTRSNKLTKQRKKSRSRIKTIAGRLLRDFERNACAWVRKAYRNDLDIIKRILQQIRHDKNKVYSLHDPGVLCIAKGKAHKRYEFGRKASIGILRESCVIVSAVSFEENLYDGDTLEQTLKQTESLTGKVFKSALVDKGYRGRPKVGQTQILIPCKPHKDISYYHRRKQRKRYARRSAIEPVIGHLKSDYRMARCFLKGALGSGINLGLAAAAWNLKKWINELIFAVIFWSDYTRDHKKYPRYIKLYPV